MNVTLPDGASIQIIVMPQGAASLPVSFGTSAPVMLPNPARKFSRRRDVAFLTVGACLCAVVLGVVRTQSTPARIIDPAHAAASSSPGALSALPATEPGQGRERAELAAAPPIDPTETVRRLLDQRPTVTPPPGAPSPSAVTPGTGAAQAAHNAFGMTD